MAAYTTAQSGNWSASSTWTTTPPTGGPGIGDTVVWGGKHTVTIDSAAGASQNGVVKLGTGSGTCITGPTSYSTVTPSGSGVLTIANGNQLWLRGNAVDGGGGWLLINVGTTAGASLYFDPPNSSTQIEILSSAGYAMLVAANGTSSNPAVIKTDFTRAGGTGLNGLISTTAQSGGLYLATYTQLTNLGNSTTFGVQINTAWTYAVSITNCTFTNCSFFFSSNTDVNFTFSDNIFSSSPSTTTGGIYASASFNASANPSAGVRTITYNSFDQSVVFESQRGFIFTDNYMGGFYCVNGPQWPSISNCARNFVQFNDTGTGSSGVVLYGSAKDWFLFDTNSTNPHYCGADAATMTISGFIFQSSGTGGQGDCIVPGTSGGTLTVTNCIVLPDASTSYVGTSGKLISYLGSGTNQVVIAEHNTYVAGTGGGDSDDAVAALGESGGAQLSGAYSSVRANLPWSAAAASLCLAANDITSGGGYCNNVTAAGYNGFWNPSTGTCYYGAPTGGASGGTTQTGVVGYAGLRVSNANSFPDSQIGTGDISGNPAFVDSTRCLATWGGTAAGGGTATNAGALAALAANPALIGQATTGLLAWIRAGFRPTNSAFEATGWSGDTSTADAAGNSWPGSTPGFGAMAYYAGTASTASGAITLGYLAVTGSGNFAAPGSGSITLSSLAVAGAGSFAAPASSAITLGAITPAGSGSFTTTASGTVALAALAVAGSATASAPGTTSGSGTIILGSIAVAGSGSFATTASGTIALGSLVPSGAGGFTTTASGSVALAALTVAGSATASAPGVATSSGAVTLGPIVPAGSASFSTAAAGSAVLAQMTVAGAGTAIDPGASTGSGAVMLAALTAAGSASFATTASGAITLGSIIVVGVSGYVALYLPYEFTSVLITSGLTPSD